MTLPHVNCPKCGVRNTPPEEDNYFQCSSCSFLEPKGSVVLEENKDYEEERERRVETRDEELRKWENEQVELTREMINYCLPQGQYNWELDCSQNLGKGYWGETEYHENNPQEIELFKIRHRDELFANGLYEIKMLPNRMNVIVPRYPSYNGSFCCPCSKPTKIIISDWVLQTEGEYKFDGKGYFPTIPHETAHADPAVHRHPNYQPFSEQFGEGIGHDDIWRKKNQEFYDKLVARGYKEKVKKRFELLQKIKREK